MSFLRRSPIVLAAESFSPGVDLLVLEVRRDVGIDLQRWDNHFGEVKVTTTDRHTTDNVFINDFDGEATVRFPESIHRSGRRQPMRLPAYHPGHQHQPDGSTTTVQLRLPQSVEVEISIV